MTACYHRDGEQDAQPGHIDDFPWSWWAHEGRSCDKPQLKLVSTGRSAGLAGLRVVCESEECKKRNTGRTLEDVFRPDRFSNLRCRANRPWLGDAEENCDRPIRVVMRGASNVYFPIVVSALSIPPNSGFLLQQVGRQRLLMENFGQVDTSTLVTMAKNSIHGLRGSYSDQQIEDAIRTMATGEEGGPATDAEQRQAERIAIVEERSDRNDAQSEFVVERISDEDLERAAIFDSEHLVQAHRLREVRVLRGFQRIEPVRDADPYRVACAPISRDIDLPWLPAIEVNGEGVYFEFRSEAVLAWEERDAVRERAAMLQANVERYRRRQGGSTPISPPPPRFVLAHTLSHLMINQLSLDCGYSSASLRERLYVGQDGAESWIGFLIYTASPGADGTLGGLVRQGSPELLERTLRAALGGAAWCSSDPLCIESTGQGADALNLAACHACCIVSETSCEHRNLFLDRGLLVGTPDLPTAGFFSGTSFII